jgi:hypothetical protein
MTWSVFSWNKFLSYFFPSQARSVNHDIKPKLSPLFELEQFFSKELIFLLEFRRWNTDLEGFKTFVHSIVEDRFHQTMDRCLTSTENFLNVTQSILALLFFNRVRSNVESSTSWLDFGARSSSLCNKP